MYEVCDSTTGRIKVIPRDILRWLNDLGNTELVCHKASKPDLLSLFHMFLLPYHPQCRLTRWPLYSTRWISHSLSNLHYLSPQLFIPPLYFSLSLVRVFLSAFIPFPLLFLFSTVSPLFLPFHLECGRKHTFLDVSTAVKQNVYGWHIKSDGQHKNVIHLFVSNHALFRIVTMCIKHQDNDVPSNPLQSYLVSVNTFPSIPVAG